MRIYVHSQHAQYLVRGSLLAQMLVLVQVHVYDFTCGDAWPLFATNIFTDKYGIEGILLLTKYNAFRMCP